MNKKSGIELLRIVAILMITLHHITFTVGIDSVDMYTRLWGQFFFIGGKVGVNCFVLITGYFLCQKKLNVGDSVLRIVKLHSQVMVYCFIGLLIAFVGNIASINTVLKSLFPVIFDTYWFVTAYVGLIFLSPILNIVISKLNKEEHTIGIVLMLTLISIIPTFTAQTIFNSNLIWFIFLYIFAAYIKIYNPKFKYILSKKYMPFALWILIWLGSVAFTIGESWIPQLREGTNFFTGMYILPQFLNSVSWFLLFLNLNIKSNFINKIGSHTFAGYLVQSNFVLFHYIEPMYVKIFNHFTRGGVSNCDCIIGY